MPTKSTEPRNKTRLAEAHSARPEEATMDEVLKAAGGNSLRGLRGMLRKPGKTATLAEIEAGIVRGARVMIGIDICRMATATFDRKAAKAAGFVAIK